MSAERRPGLSGSLRRVQPATRTEAQRILGDAEASLLDVVDNVLSKGVVVTGDITIALAQVDLIYARLSVLLCAADRVLPTEDPEPKFRRRARRARRLLANRGV
jgi:hypothetical protein